MATNETMPTADAGPVERVVGRPVEQRTENDCEEQGYSDVREGCNKWPCNGTPLVQWRLGWRCTKCEGCY
jgi:hypothetical protein